MRVAEKERPTQKPSRNEVNRKRDKKRSRLSAFDTLALSPGFLASSWTEGPQKMAARCGLSWPYEDSILYNKVLKGKVRSVSAPAEILLNTVIWTWKTNR